MLYPPLCLATKTVVGWRRTCSFVSGTDSWFDMMPSAFSVLVGLSVFDDARKESRKEEGGKGVAKLPVPKEGRRLWTCVFFFSCRRVVRARIATFVCPFFLSRLLQMSPSFDKECMTYEGPNSRILRLASHWPMSMACSSDLPSTMPATKPPAKASLFAHQRTLAFFLASTAMIWNRNAYDGRWDETHPAPFVSQISSFLTLLTGNSFTFTLTSPSSPFPSAIATSVGSVPCVTITVRDLLLFFLGSCARCFAMVVMSVVRRAWASA